MSQDALLPATRTKQAGTEFPVRRRVATHITGGLDGVLRIAGMLRTRGYRVLDLEISICDGVVESSVVCTVLIGTHEIDLLLERLRRIPSVVASEIA